jgi:hypothetical protein
MWRIGLFIIASLLLGGAHAAPAQAASAQAASAQAAAPCALVCFPPTVLNVKKCACEAGVAIKPVCTLVCLDPDQALDARRCACVRRPR